MGGRGGSKLLNSTRRKDNTDFGGDYKIDNKGIGLDEISKILGFDIDLDTLGKLLGAPKGAELFIQSGTYGYGFGNKGIIASGFGKSVGNLIRVVYFDKDGKLVIYNSQLQKAKGVASGFAKNSLNIQKAAAKKIGVDRIEAQATGSKNNVYNGYYTLPRLGYNGNLKPEWLKSAPKNLQSAKTVQSLFKRKGGKEWWKNNGRTFDVQIKIKKK